MVGHGPAPLLLLALATSLMLGMLVGNSRRRVRFGMVFALLAVVWLAGCGGGSATPPIINPGTPLGSHTLTVTGSVSQGVNTLTHDTVLTLVVN